jgi:hypothetical protein
MLQQLNRNERHVTRQEKNPVRRGTFERRQDATQRAAAHHTIPANDTDAFSSFPGDTFDDQ